MLFPLVNEFAVLGTAFFLIALGTLWYSPLLFGNPWLKEQGGVLPSPSISQQWLTQFLPTFVAYVVLLGLIALALPLLSKLGVAPFMVAFWIVLAICSAWIPLARLEQRSLRYVMIHVGFVALMVCVGTSILHYWPW